MNWSSQQEHALRECSRWMSSRSSAQVFYLAGYAGTGKTTLARHLVGNSPGRWLFAAFTGKAAYVLRQKGCEGASTIHSLIYRPAGESISEEARQLEIKIDLLALKRDPLTPEEIAELERLRRAREQLKSRQPRFTVWEGSRLADPDVAGVVVDEVSMVDHRLGVDLESFGKKILVLGDPAQLPPVGAGGYYTRREPDVQMTEIHRHARESGILRLATIVREGGDYASLGECDDVTLIDSSDKDAVASAIVAADQALCGLNASRHNTNHWFRKRLGISSEGPVAGDRVVCLRNDNKIGLFNGSQWIVQKAHSEMASLTCFMTIVSEEDSREKMEVESWLHHMVSPSQVRLLEQMSSFERRDMEEFDWSYCMTVHKAQGSQWDHVALRDQASSFRGHARRWLYTGVTRAARKLTVIR